MFLISFSIISSAVADLGIDKQVEMDYFTDYDLLMSGLDGKASSHDEKLRFKRDSSNTEPSKVSNTSDDYDLKLTDGSGLLLGRLKTSKPIEVEVLQRGEKGEAVVKGSVELSSAAAVSASKDASGNVDVILTYSGISGPSDSNLNITAQEVKISFKLVYGSPRGDYWNASAIVASLTGSLEGNGTNVPLNFSTDVTPKSGKTANIADAQCTNGYGICAPLLLSWSCGSQVLSPLTLSSQAATAYSVRLSFSDLQIQVGDKTSWLNNWDCDPILSIGLWSTLLVTLLLVAILTYAIAMISTVATPDKYDDPKGPVLNLGQQSE